MTAPATTDSAEADLDQWTPVAVDATGKVIDEDLLREFFADPVGTFNSFDEWPARLLVVRDTALPRPGDGGEPRIHPGHLRSDILMEVNAQQVTAPDIECTWKQFKAIVAAVNSTKRPLPSGPTGGY